ncbi:hypothetical protein JZ751_007009 [Albula glossodonta]|uniref:Uncharacterized protein n=1 Tax=Albula glossodonta TaxID=121402 RepID=A0A8T2P4R2_9TELE|nr:hypothetical protein JZ751_007009 [Albula glossodonta]
MEKQGVIGQRERETIKHGAACSSHTPPTPQLLNIRYDWGKRHFALLLYPLHSLIETRRDFGFGLAGRGEPIYCPFEEKEKVCVRERDAGSRAVSDSSGGGGGGGGSRDEGQFTVTPGIFVGERERKREGQREKRVRKEKENENAFSCLELREPLCSTVLFQHINAQSLVSICIRVSQLCSTPCVKARHHNTPPKLEHDLLRLCHSGLFASTIHRARLRDIPPPHPPRLVGPPPPFGPPPLLAPTTSGPLSPSLESPEE